MYSWLHGMFFSYPLSEAVQLSVGALAKADALFAFLGKTKPCRRLHRNQRRFCVPKCLESHLCSARCQVTHLVSNGGDAWVPNEYTMSSGWIPVHFYGPKRHQNNNVLFQAKETFPILFTVTRLLWSSLCQHRYLFAWIMVTISTNFK